MWNLGQFKGIKLYMMCTISLYASIQVLALKRDKVLAEFRLDRFYLDTLHVK